MTIEAELGNQVFSLVGSGAGGYFMGWGLGKVMKLVVKVVAGAVGVFFGVLVYLQTQGFVSLNWDKMQLASDNAVHSILSTGVISDSVGNNGGIYHVVESLGLPVASGLCMGFFFGITKGLRG